MFARIGLMMFPCAEPSSFSTSFPSSIPAFRYLFTSQRMFGSLMYRFRNKLYPLSRTFLKLINREHLFVKYSLYNTSAILSSRSSIADKNSSRISSICVDRSSRRSRISSYFRSLGLIIFVFLLTTRLTSAVTFFFPSRLFYDSS